MNPTEVAGFIGGASAVASSGLTGWITYKLTKRQVESSKAVADAQRAHEQAMAREERSQRRLEETYLAALALMEREMFIVRNRRLGSWPVTELPPGVPFDENVVINARLSLLGGPDPFHLYTQWWQATNRFGRQADLLDQTAKGPDLVPSPYPDEWQSMVAELEKHRETAIRLSDEFEQLVRTEMLPRRAITS
jgi:hypothetical protein